MLSAPGTKARLRPVRSHQHAARGVRDREPQARSDPAELRPDRSLAPGGTGRPAARPRPGSRTPTTRAACPRRTTTAGPDSPPRNRPSPSSPLRPHTANDPRTGSSTAQPARTASVAGRAATAAGSRPATGRARRTRTPPPCRHSVGSRGPTWPRTGYWRCAISLPVRRETDSTVQQPVAGRSCVPSKPATYAVSSAIAIPCGTSQPSAPGSHSAGAERVVVGRSGPARRGPYDGAPAPHLVVATPDRSPRLRPGQRVGPRRRRRGRAPRPARTSAMTSLRQEAKLAPCLSTSRSSAGRSHPRQPTR